MLNLLLLKAQRCVDWTVRLNVYTVHVVPARSMQLLDWGDLLPKESSTHAEVGGWDQGRVKTPE